MLTVDWGSNMRILIALVVLVAIAAAGYWWWTTTPQYSIEQAKDAIKTHDIQKFEKYVDVDTASARMVDDFVTKPLRRAMAPSTLGQIIVSGIAGLLRPKIADGIKHEILTFVESGSFKRSDADDADPHLGDAAGPSLSKADSHFGFRAHHSFKGFGSAQINGNVALVPVILHNAKYNQDLTLDVRLRKTDGHWQVIELSNFSQFCKQLARLQAAQDGRAIEEDDESDQTARLQQI
jgi:hypothetical protein